MRRRHSAGVLTDDADDVELRCCVRDGGPNLVPHRNSRDFVSTLLSRPGCVRSIATRSLSTDKRSTHLTHHVDTAHHRTGGPDSSFVSVGSVNVTTSMGTNVDVVKDKTSNPTPCAAFTLCNERELRVASHQTMGRMGKMRSNKLGSPSEPNSNQHKQHRKLRSTHRNSQPDTATPEVTNDVIEPEY